MGRITGGGLVACLWLWTSTSTLHASPASDPVPTASYQSALDRFNQADYPRALRFLDAAPAGRNAHEQADILNLRGAIFLREHRNNEARAAFAEAARLDPGFLAARFNEVEVDFREKRYAESHRQFSALLAQTGKLGHSTERHFIEYKLMLADLLDGNDKPALDYIAAHRADQPPPLTWYYLNAALEYQHGHAANGAAWLQQVGTHYAASSEQVFANSFAELGWSSHDEGTERLAVRERTPAASAPTPVVAASAKPVSTHGRTAPKPPAATVAVVELAPDRVHASAVPASTRPKGKDMASADAPLPLIAKESPARAQNAPPATLTTINVVSLMPSRGPSPAAEVPPQADTNASGPRPAVHFGFNPASANPPVEQMPPSEVGLVLSADELNNPAHAASAAARVMAKPTSGHKAHASPSPSATPADGDAASSSPLPSPDASASPSSGAAAPSGTPSPAFVQKYEAAMVQFLQKDYPGATKLLDEADTIQPGQPNSVTLRNQIFKQYYEGAYSAYQHTDYPNALTQLDGADAAHSNSQNQSDAYNLRGLVLSKQRNYEGAENMFHKAVQTDPGLWAAKFNYAEVPFNYRNFTVARARFEELFSQTDPVKQPVEAELTQFKVFLTLLLEGKEDAARTFMQHFNFSGATPARYFCQASLNFYAGDVDKAQGWIDSARKEYPARKSSSFLEAFYRVGWLTDPNVPSTGAPSTALAGASPSVAPSATPSLSSPTPAVAAATPSPKASASASPALAAAASPAVASTSPAVLPAFRILVTPPPTVLATPSASPSPSAALVAKTSPTTTPAPILLAKASATPSALPSATPAATTVAKASATVTPLLTAPALVKASPTVAPASPIPAIAKASPASPAPAVASTSVSPSPTASATAMAATSPKPAPSAPAVVVTTPAPAPSAPMASASPESSPADAGEMAAQPDSSGDIVRVVVVSVVGLYFLYAISRVGWAVMSRKSKRTLSSDASSYRDQKAAEADEVEVKR